eukprot:554156_1
MTSTELDEKQEQKAEKVDGIPIYFKPTKYNRKLFQSDIINNRYNVNDDTDEVLITEAGMQFIESGKNAWRFDPSKPQGMLSVELPDDDKNYIVTIDATWYSAREAKENGINVIRGKSANIFSGLGCILVPDNFKIPSIKATFENVSFYGCKLIKNGSDFSVVS